MSTLHTTSSLISQLGAVKVMALKRVRVTSSAQLAVTTVTALLAVTLVLCMQLFLALPATAAAASSLRSTGHHAKTIRIVSAYSAARYTRKARVVHMALVTHDARIARRTRSITDHDQQPSAEPAPLICQARFEFGKVTNSTNGNSTWFTTSVDIYVKNLGNTTVSPGWTFSAHNPAYMQYSNARNFKMPGFKRHSIIGTVDGKQQSLEPQGASEQKISFLVSTSSPDRFLPTYFTVNGVDCHVIAPSPQLPTVISSLNWLAGKSNCQARVVMSEPWTGRMGYTAALNVFLKNLGDEAIPQGWTFTMTNPDYIGQTSTWNFHVKNFRDHTFTGTSSLEPSSLLEPHGNEVNLGIILSSASPSFLPTLFTLNGENCHVVGVDLVKGMDEVMTHLVRSEDPIFEDETDADSDLESDIDDDTPGVSELLAESWISPGH